MRASDEKTFRIKKNINVSQNYSANLRKGENTMMTQTMPQSLNKFIANSKDNEEVVIDTPEDSKFYENSSGIDPEPIFPHEKLSTIIESPNIDRGDPKASEESKSIRVGSQNTPCSNTDEKSKKVVLKKSIIKEMEKKLSGIKKGSEKSPKIKLKPTDISFKDTNPPGITKNGATIMKITENTFSVTYFHLNSHSLTIRIRPILILR